MKKPKLPQDIQHLMKEFKSQLDAQVQVQPVWPGKRYRFAVTSPRFHKVAQLKRQDRVWQIVDNVLDRSKQLKVSMVVAYAPEELADSKLKRKAKTARRARA